jgi:hypothetical protein
MAASPSGRAYAVAAGVIFLAGFGTVWLYGGVFLAGRATLPALALLAAGAVLLLGGAFILCRRAVPDPANADSARIARVFKQMNLAQYAAMTVAIVGANLAGRPDLIPALISCVVALHFLPLAGLFGNPVYYVTTPAILLLDALAVLHAPHESGALAAMATGSVLWCTAIFQLVRGMRLVHRETSQRADVF